MRCCNTNLIEISDFKAVIKYNPEIEMFRGEFLGLSGGADFYAKDIDKLKKEGAISLKVFLDAYKKNIIQNLKKNNMVFQFRKTTFV